MGYNSKYAEMKKETTPLKPCPFCGEDAKMQLSYGELYLIQCTSCHICTPHLKNIKHVIDAWNKRA